MKLLNAAAAAALFAACASDAHAAFVRTIEAPNGVGDVVALTNALTELNALADAGRSDMRVWLRPGTYNLTGVYMTSTHHLQVKQSLRGLVAGLGDGPGDTILIGGGETEAHGVLSMEGGGNWGFNTISNLTLTGGWSTADGGGISGSASIEYRNLIVSNNYAKGSGNGTGGGGCFRGRAFGCLFADNHCTDRWGGGLLVSGYSTRNENEGQGAWNCVFVGNSAHQNGGGLAINAGGQCHGCSFTNNTASNGGAVYVHAVNYATFSGTPRTTSILGGSFCGNNGSGAGIYVNQSVGNVPTADCVFRLNGGSRTVSGGEMKNCIVERNSSSIGVAQSTMKDCIVRWNQGTSADGCDMEDCVVEANTNSTAIVNDCNMTRCVLKDNVVTSRYADGIDACATVGDKTNVNCRIENNRYINEYGAILKNKALVNCTILDNDAANGNWGRPLDACVLWNCVLLGNRLGSTRRDVRINYKNGGEYSIWMTNCFFVASDFAASEIGADGTITHDGFCNCRQISADQLKFLDAANGNYTPHHRSPLHDAGLRDDWILSAVGATDLAGNPRLVGEGLDIGAYESQWKPKSIAINFR